MSVAESERIAVTFSPEMMRCLNELAESRQVSRGEIIREALSLFYYIFEVKKEAPNAKMLIERKSGEKMRELVLPKFAVPVPATATAANSAVSAC